MVLDGVVDPKRVWYQANLDQDPAFEHAIRVWFAWVARYDSVYRLGKTEAAVRKRWYAEQDALRRRPAGGDIGPAEWTDLFVSAAYYQSTWTDEAALFASWVHDRDVDVLRYTYQTSDDYGDDNGFAVYNAVQCTDAKAPTKWRTWRTDAKRVAARSPFLTYSNLWFNAPCHSWPVRAGTPSKVDGRRAPKILLVNQTGDAATPYAGAKVVRRLFPRSVLLAEPGGTTHAGSLGGNRCTDDVVARYLKTGATVRRHRGTGADVTCAPLPKPTPSRVQVTELGRSARTPAPASDPFSLQAVLQAAQAPR
ncbi:hypothetical protein GCM10025868_35640 [Angustibacter aerolatus]|uniref:Peptidase S33 tripeptidyl aminopeptidase-like C-terminal domain-containing protein n=1 Tax=Angustibacter aerolatus TaxID=1162965 RepID=A0ABQ6JLV3_9ACTN|nr:hypothetical protein GCM10025868_35640 [Angustibacter aerolatus]